MRKLTFSKKKIGGMYEILLSEREWRSLVARFNPARAKKGIIGTRQADRFTIDVPCILCELYACDGCPAENDWFTCDTVLKMFELHTVCGSGEIAWDVTQDEEVRKGIVDLRNVLLSLPYVKGRRR